MPKRMLEMEAVSSVCTAFLPFFLKCDGRGARHRKFVSTMRRISNLQVTVLPQRNALQFPSDRSLARRKRERDNCDHATGIQGLGGSSTMTPFTRTFRCIPSASSDRRQYIRRIWHRSFPPRVSLRRSDATRSLLEINQIARPTCLVSTNAPCFNPTSWSLRMAEKRNELQKVDDGE